MYIQTITTEAILSIILALALLALLTYVLKDEPSNEGKPIDLGDIITRNDDVQSDSSLKSDCEVRLRNVLISTGGSEQP